MKQDVMKAVQLEPPRPLRLPTWRTRRVHGQRAVGSRSTAVVVDPQATTTAEVWAEDLWNAHGSSVYALACALLGNETAAMRAVALGMSDLLPWDVHTSASETRRTLARHVYRRSLETASPPSTSPDLPPVMRRLARLARLQRASVALCTFGGHTYAEAAEVLSVAPLTVAQLLTSGLVELGHMSTPVESA